MPDDHFLAPPQVTAMDDQFGTHRLLADSRRNPRDGWVRALLALARGDTDRAIEECTVLARHQPDRWLMAHLVAQSGDARPLPSDVSVVALDPRAKPSYYLPPFSRAEVAALTLCVAGRPADGARLLEQAVPLRLPGERWHRPVYELLKSRTGADLGGVQRSGSRSGDKIHIASSRGARTTNERAILETRKGGGKGGTMADPVTLTVLGSWAAAEGIKFLYGQAGELIKAKREKGKSAETTVPIKESPALEGAPSSDTANLIMVDREHQALADLSDALAPYVKDPSTIDLRDADLAATAGRLRAVLEAVYGQRLTFHGEQREPTGTRVTVSQVLGTVDGTVTGAEADVESSATIDVEQRIDRASEGSSVTGFKGIIR